MPVGIQDTRLLVILQAEQEQQWRKQIQIKERDQTYGKRTKNNDRNIAGRGASFLG